MSFEVPEHVQPIRERVRRFIETEVYPVESALEERGSEASRQAIGGLMAKAKEQGLWALGHPKEIGGQGLPFLDYVYINEVVGRSELATVALGTHSLQDSIMLNLHASPKWRDTYLKPLVEGEVFPSFAMPEPDVASSDPTQLRTHAELDGDRPPAVRGPITIPVDLAWWRSEVDESGRGEILSGRYRIDCLECRVGVPVVLECAVRPSQS